MEIPVPESVKNEIAGYLCEKADFYKKEGVFQEVIYILMKENNVPHFDLSEDFGKDALRIADGYIQFLGGDEETLVEYWPWAIHNAYLDAYIYRDFIVPAIDKKKEKILTEVKAFYYSDDEEIDLPEWSHRFLRILKYDASSRCSGKGLYKKIRNYIPRMKETVYKEWPQDIDFDSFWPGYYDDIEFRLETLLFDIADDIALSRYFDDFNMQDSSSFQEFWSGLVVAMEAMGLEDYFLKEVASNDLLFGSENIAQINPSEMLSKIMDDDVEEDDESAKREIDIIKMKISFCFADSYVRKILVDPVVAYHRKKLEVKKSQLIFKGHYGEVDESKWIKEVEYFASTVFSSEIGCGQEVLEALKETIGDVSEIYCQNYGDRILSICRNTVLEEIDYDESASWGEGYKPDFDGIEYELYVVGLFSETDIEARQTTITGDFGLDVICKRGRGSIGLQCKHYSSPIGVGAVQEAYSGKGYYDCQSVAVISNAGFTPAARMMATKLGVLLGHHDEVVSIVKHALGSV